MWSLNAFIIYLFICCTQHTWAVPSKWLCKKYSIASQIDYIICPSVLLIFRNWCCVCVCLCEWSRTTKKCDSTNKKLMYLCGVSMFIIVENMLDIYREMEGRNVEVDDFGVQTCQIIRPATSPQSCRITCNRRQSVSTALKLMASNLLEQNWIYIYMWEVCMCVQCMHVINIDTHT